MNPGLAQRAEGLAMAGLYKESTEPWNKLDYFTNTPTEYRFSVSEA